MLFLSRKDRCKKCLSERALRLCPRINKGLGWKCCNEIRIDMKCPSSCPYAPKSQEDSPFPAFKADNNHEAVDAMRSYINVWIKKDSSAFDGKSPAELGRSDSDKLLAILSEYQYPGNFPIDYLMQKLDLPHVSDVPNETAEDVVARYLDGIISADFASLRALTMNDSPMADLEDRYERIMRKIPYYKKLNRYNFIHSGMTEDRAQSIVFVELNQRDEYCFVLRNEDGSWSIRQSLNGNPSLYFKQNELHQRIATYLANAEDQKAYEEITESLRSYPDSADLYYYRALYWLLVKQPEKSKEDLLNSIALDNLFAPPYMHLGLLYLNDKNYDQAKLWFAACVKIAPEDLNAANNLAIAHLAQGEKAEATKIWKEILDRDPNYEMAKKNLEIYG
jgi:hypothetical protein